MSSVLSLRVLVNAVSAKSGGAVVSTENLCRNLGSIGSRHHFIFLVPLQLSYRLRGLSPNVQIIPSDIGLGPPWKRFLWDQITLRRVAKEQMIDILVSTSGFGMLFPPCRQILMIENPLYFSSLYSKQILPRKSWEYRFQLSLRRCLISLSVRFSKVVVTPSQSMMALIKQVIPSLNGKSLVNCFGVSMGQFSWRQLLDYYRKNKENGGKSFQILYVSEYNDHKNLTMLLKAVLILKEQGVDDFLLVSTLDPWQFPDTEIVTREEDQALATHPLISPFVKFTGLVPYEDVPTLYAQSDLFVFPSLAESFGYPMVEAMASRLPIVASDISICREICGEAALYFNPLDPSELAAKILSLRNDPDRRKQLGETGRKRAEKLFDLSDHLQRLLDLIDMVGSERKG